MKKSLFSLNCLIWEFSNYKPIKCLLHLFAYCTGDEKRKCRGFRWKQPERGISRQYQPCSCYSIYKPISQASRAHVLWLGKYVFCLKQNSHPQNRNYLLSKRQTWTGEDCVLFSENEMGLDIAGNPTTFGPNMNLQKFVNSWEIRQLTYHRRLLQLWSERTNNTTPVKFHRTHSQGYSTKRPRF